MTYAIRNPYLEGPVLDAVINGKPARVKFLPQGARIALLTTSTKWVDTGSNVSQSITIERPGAASVMRQVTQATFSSPTSSTSVVPMVYTAHNFNESAVAAGFGTLKKYDAYPGFTTHTACFLAAGTSGLGKAARFHDLTE
ncbi:MAG TPA: hypothetical protein VFH85_02395 [Gammaproteobacteria bacterium]|nr:hypothetical protein [Gammaproteobacteria bacterium]